MDSSFDPELTLEEALAFHQGGDLLRAETGYRRVLLAEPDHPDALNFLGLLLQNSGRYSDSLALLEKAVTQMPDFAEALTNLARVQQITGQTEAAVASATRAIASDPELPQAHLLLGRSLFDMNDLAGAEIALRTAIRLQPGDSDSHMFLGAVLCSQGRIAEAGRAYEVVLDLQPNRVETTVRVVDAWMGASQFGAAVETGLRAVALYPVSGVAHATLACAYRGQQRWAAAATSCRNALGLTPDRADLWLLLGNSLATLGRADEAATAYREALSRNPNSVSARRDLAAIGCLSADGVDADHLRAVLQDKVGDEQQKIVAAFGLGMAFDQAGDYDHAFEALTLANGMLRTQRTASGRGFQPVLRRREVDWLTTTFEPNLFRRLVDCGSPSDDLVFIVGMPRSGISLIAQIAASHRSVAIAGRPGFINALIARLNGGPDQKSPETWVRDSVRREALACLDQYRSQAPGAPMIIDTSPDTMLTLGYIAVLFPDARVIFSDRDARDTCLSAHFQDFGDDVAWSSSLADCAVEAQEVARLAAHWRQTLNLRMLDIQYETLISDIAGQSRRLIEFLGLTWDPACLLFDETDRTVPTARHWQARPTLDASTAGRWRHYRSHVAGLIFGLWGLVPAPEQEDWVRLLNPSRQALDVAMAHHRDGRIDAARQIYEAVLANEPDHPAALHLLGIWCLQHGTPQQALIWLQKSAAAEVPGTKLRTDLARTYNVMRDFVSGAACARIAIEQDPAWSGGWCQLGHALAGLSDTAGAASAFERAYALAPDDRDIIIAQATALTRQRQFDAAAALWRRADDRYPGNADILEGLSWVLAELGQTSDSVRACEQAMLCRPGSPKLMTLRASLLIRNRDVDPAMELLQAALRIDDTLVDSWLQLGYVQAMRGRHDEAARSYSKILSLEPGHASAITGLVNIARTEASDDVLALMAKIHLDPAATAIDRASAGFLLAEAAQKRGDHDAAFAAFQSANAVNRAARTGLEPGQQARGLAGLVDALGACFTRRTVGDMARLGIDSALPAFIVGLPRSGTSLVEQIAASHPAVVGLGERDDFIAALGPDLLPMWQLPMALWDADKVREAANGFVERLRERDTDASRIIDKLPSNVRWLGHIAALLPNARIIVCRRDLRDILWSCYTHSFQEDGMAWADTLEDCAAYAREVERLMDHWNQVFPGRFHEVYYEDMVEDLEGEARRLIDYLGLPWDPACLSFHKTERVVMTASHWQVRQPLYATSVGRWRPYRKHLGPLLDGLKGLIPDDD